MTLFNVKWSVTEVINGPGLHDGGVRDGDRNVVASGDVDKEAPDAESLRTDLTEALKKAFPEKGLGPTYFIDRLYSIEVTER